MKRVDQSRRRFFNDYFIKNTIRAIVEFHETYKETRNDLAYFESFESAYPLISESYSFLEDEAKRLDIDTTGMSKLEIVKEIYDRNKKRS
ncbi:MAG: hypothetical protein M0Q23_03130 [Syntrophales bacterium]|jgi:uncharacterized protein YprB with RNaseH-like and TPR domain|nr:hypothetical protein [Syntrophales bacterium]MCK9527639.1 hypothetical protein [Syntrophales bacterium]MDX9922256.1 hypothetical protein [Syntrophales bacterium]